jgi:hypothetical protein
MAQNATFDENEHANTPGWATYFYPQNEFKGWRRQGCRLIGHRPGRSPEIQNGYSPSNYGRCPICRNFMKWFVIGQHRRGGFDRGEA